MRAITYNYNTESERRIRNNRRKRTRQIRRNMLMLAFTVLLVTSISSFAFGLRVKASNEEMSYKYYKSITIASGDTLWNLAEDYADLNHYDSKEQYIKEVMNMNHLKNDKLISGSSIIIPYYSNVFVEE